MEVFNKEPALQFYGGNFMDGSDTAKHSITANRLRWKPNIARFTQSTAIPKRDFKSGRTV